MLNLTSEQMKKVLMQINSSGEVDHIVTESELTGYLAELNELIKNDPDGLLFDPSFTEEQTLNYKRTLLSNFFGFPIN